MRPSHNIGAEYTMVYSIRDVTRGQTPVMGAVVYSLKCKNVKYDYRLLSDLCCVLFLSII